MDMNAFGNVVDTLPFNDNRRFTLVVSSCPWKIDAQVTTGVQITLAREKYIFLKY
jgi:hypothetical protein